MAPPQRLIVLQLNDKVHVNPAKGRYGTETRTTSITSFFVPQYAMEQLDRYKSALQTALSNDDPTEAPIVKDEEYISQGHSTKALQNTIDYVGGAPLPALNTDKAAAILRSLLDVYDVCEYLNVKSLEDAILNHIKVCEDLPLEVFVKFAAIVYGDNCSTQRARESPIGKLIQQKLTVLKPRLIEEGLSTKIAKEGGMLCVVFYEISTSAPTAHVAIKTER